MGCMSLSVYKNWANYFRILWERHFINFGKKWNWSAVDLENLYTLNPVDQVDIKFRVLNILS